MALVHSAFSRYKRVLDENLSSSKKKNMEEGIFAKVNPVKSLPLSSIFRSKFYSGLGGFEPPTYRLKACHSSQTELQTHSKDISAIY